MPLYQQEIVGIWNSGFGLTVEMAVDIIQDDWRDRKRTVLHHIIDKAVATKSLSEILNKVTPMFDSWSGIGGKIAPSSTNLIDSLSWPMR